MPQPMDEQVYWTLVEQARSRAGQDAEPVEVVEEFVGLLTQRPVEDVVAAAWRFADLSDRANRWDLWGAAYLAMGGCSDDAFDYFKGWLIVQGQAAYLRVLEEPDLLATLTQVSGEDILEAEDMLYAADLAYEEHTGEEEIPDELYDGPSYDGPAGSSDVDFDDDAAMAARYPRLWAAVNAD